MFEMLSDINVKKKKITAPVSVRDLRKGAAFLVHTDL